ncbi:hypothetical protein SAMN05428949_1986 [Chitinophaga sp. YR627]|nr:hypothetical protein SAMN05428949_1986 [Chitinophaga sp. YR627]
MEQTLLLFYLVFEIAEAMLQIGAVDTKEAYSREMMPVSVFLLRQAIEVYGKRTVGYFSIINKSDTLTIQAVGPDGDYSREYSYSPSSERLLLSD